MNSAPTPCPIADGRYLCRRLSLNGRTYAPGLLTVSGGKAAAAPFDAETHTTIYINTPLEITTDRHNRIINAKPII